MKHWYTIKAQAGEQPAEITIFDSIGATWDGEGVTAKHFIADLQALKADKITLLVNSPGGSVFDGLAIYNALVATKAEITGKVMGVAASAASFILMAAKKIVMPENSFLMIHNPSSMAWGDANTMRETADWLDKVGDTLVNIYASRTGKTVEDVKAWLNAETWFTAAEAKEHGFCDDVIAAFKATAQFEVDKLPEHIRVAFNVAEPAPEPVAPVVEPEPVVPATPFAKEVAAAANAAGFPALGVVLALDASVTDMAAVTAALANAAEVVALCDVAGAADKADALVRARTPLAEVRAQLCKALADADADPSNAINTAAPSAAMQPKPAATVDVSAIYAKANANSPMNRSNK